MPFVSWHYRNGIYVSSHYRRPPRRRADASTLTLFAPAVPVGVTVGLPRRDVDERGERTIRDAATDGGAPAR